MNALTLILAVVFGLTLLFKLFAGNNSPVFIRRILGGSIGPRTDVENMSRNELLRSGIRFIVFGAGCILVVFVLFLVLPNRSGAFQGLLLFLNFALFFGALIGCFGGFYLLVRGSLRDREYMVPIQVSSRAPLNDFQKKISFSLDEALNPYCTKAIISSGTYVIKKKGEVYYWEEYSVDTGRPGSFRLKAEVYSYFLRISMDEWSDDYNVYESGLSSDEFAKNATRMIMEVLAGRVKIEVKSINGKPYRWTRYDLIDGEWNTGLTLESRIHGIVGKKAEEEKLCRIT